MLEVTSGYSASENDFFLRYIRLLAEFEFEAFDNRLKTDGLVILEAAVAIREHCRDELLAIALESDLMNAPLPCQVVPQICCKDI